MIGADDQVCGFSTLCLDLFAYSPIGKKLANPKIVSLAIVVT
jgi:hypothetical protein